MSYRLRFLLLLFLISAGLRAQTVTDFRTRQNVGLAFELSKKVELTARYRLTTFDNATRFLRSMVSLNASYQIVKGWDAGFQYRYNTDYEQDYHRFFLFTKVKKKFDDVSISYRLRYQQDQDYFNESYLNRYPAERVLRNRLELQYAVSKRIDVYGYAEHFGEMSRLSFRSYRMRYGVGVQKVYKKRHEFSVEAFINDEFNKRRPEYVFAFDLSYTYHLKRSKKQKRDSTNL